MRDDTPRRFPDYRSLTPEEWQAVKRLGLERARDERARVVNALFGRLFRGLFGGVRRSAKRRPAKPRGLTTATCPDGTGGR